MRIAVDPDLDMMVTNPNTTSIAEAVVEKLNMPCRVVARETNYEVYDQADQHREVQFPVANFIVVETTGSGGLLDAMEALKAKGISWNPSLNKVSVHG